MKIEHNGVRFDGELVRKDHRGEKSLIYALTAHAFSDFFQYFIFGRDFFEWPLSLDSNTRAEREWLYQKEIARRLVAIENEIDGVTIEAVEFTGIEGSVIEMRKLDGYLSLYEMLKQPESIRDSDSLGKAVRVYGKWTALLCKAGIVPECNHCGNVMINQENYSRIAVIDFENYSGPLVGLAEEECRGLEKKHRMLDQGVDPVVSLALDIGILSGVKLKLEQKKYYLENFLAGFGEVFGGGDKLLVLLADERVRFLGRVRALFYDATHLSEIRETGSAVSYFDEDYEELRRFCREY